MEKIETKHDEEPPKQKEEAERIIEKTIIGRKEIQERVKRDLIERGLQREDIEFSIDLQNYIYALNYLVFSDNIPVLLDDQPYGDKNALYAPKTRKQKEGYFVYIPGQSKRLKKPLETWRFDENGELRNDLKEGKGEPITPQELLIGIAAHEVRHRMQEIKDFKKIIYYIEGKKNPTEKRAREYDANMVEFKIIEDVHAGKSLNEITEIIKKQSDEG